MGRGPRAIELHYRNRGTSSKPAWQYYFKYYSEDGKRRTQSEGGFETLEAAKRAGKAALERYNRLKHTDQPEAASMKLAEFIDKVWVPFKATQWNEATRINRRKHLKYITDALGDKRIEDITTADVKPFLDNLFLHTPMAVDSVNAIRTLLNQIFRFAVDQKYIILSPMDAYRAPNANEYAVTCEKRGQVRDVVPDEILAKIYERFPAGTSAHLLLKICELTGMRLSEAAALAFEDVDFEDRKIYVTRQIKTIAYNEKLNAREQELVEANPVLAGCKYVARNPKYNSKRVVAMNQELYDILMEAKQRQERNRRILGKDYKSYCYTRVTDPCFEQRTFASFNRKKGAGSFIPASAFENGIINTHGIGYPITFVNVKEDGTLVRPDYATDICAIIHGTNGRPVIYEDFNFHSLRNTFASHRRAEGIPSHVISAMLGHKNESTTEKYMKIDYAEFDLATSAYRGKATAPQTVSIDDNEALEAYLKTLDKAALQNVMLSVCAHISAAN